MLATDEEIRRAYKRKALELHPDRNFHDVEAATKRFAEVQTAYEVLSDPHERAWYDSHRDVILRGEEGYSSSPEGEPTTQYNNIRITSADHLWSLIANFNSSVPMTDSPEGFYGILRETFDHLAIEEEAAANADPDPVSIPKYPPFGTSTDDFDLVVRPFYNAWASFATRKSYAWKDKWRLSDAPDRRVRRAMEKENKKLRADAVREFNDTVRSLVTFVRKRDKRYKPSAEKTETEMRESSRAQAARARAANQAKVAAQSKNYVIQDWVKSGDQGDDLAGEFSEDTESDGVLEEIECVVCDKRFKTEKAFESHEKSKKHLKAVQVLKRQMQKEDQVLGLDNNTKKTNQSQRCEESDASFALKQDLPDRVSITLETEGEFDEKHILIQEEKLANTCAKDSPEKDRLAKAEVLSEQIIDTDNSDYAPRETVTARLNSVTEDRRRKKDKLNYTASPALGQPEIVTNNTDSLGDAIPIESKKKAERKIIEPMKKIGKAKQKRLKKEAAKQVTAESGGSVVEGHTCGQCYNIFPSRTKLFKHIEEMNHAQPVPSGYSRGKKVKGKR